MESSATMNVLRNKFRTLVPTCLLACAGLARAESADLQNIHEPVVVGTPPVNAFNGLVRMPDGEIRHYGGGGYVASRDHGLSWTEHRFTDAERKRGDGVAMAHNPATGTWLRTVSGRNAGTSVFRWPNGLDGPRDTIQLDQRQFIMVRPPYFLASHNRILVAGHLSSRPMRIGVFRSDDDGQSWTMTLLEPGPAFEVRPPHHQPRWENNCCEPTIVELKDGRLWMIARTSQDNHYECFSDDAGETWSSWQPSRFYGTLTMPTFLPMADGRLLFFWCNTTPLVEADRSQTPIPQTAKDGTWEDVFSNRDALHAAVSHDDGQTWAGFREIRLNPLRYDADFAEKASGDFSVHQPQAMELPCGKVLVACGQAPEVRRMLIFDPDWLEEKGRRCDFSKGLDQWSTQKYLAGIRGHCAYNRTKGPGLIEHPDDPNRKVLQLRHVTDERLVHDTDGATWNFPAAHTGELILRIRLQPGGSGARICLLDRWINPTDPHVPDYANYLLEVSGSGRIGKSKILEPGRSHSLTLSWNNTESGKCRLKIDGRSIADPIPLRRPSRNGISYIHFQSPAQGEDRDGFLVEAVEANASE
jgi:BNR repeat protein